MAVFITPKNLSRSGTNNSETLRPPPPAATANNTRADDTPADNPPSYTFDVESAAEPSQQASSSFGSRLCESLWLLFFLSFILAAGAIIIYFIYWAVATLIKTA